MPMPSSDSSSPEKQAQQGAFQTARTWGENPLPPTVLAALVFAQHARPFQTLPMLFPPLFLFSSYLNVQGYKTDAAGITGAWSAAYLVLARRRKHPFSSRFGARGLVRGATLGLCFANMLGCGVAYAFGEKTKVAEEVEKVEKA